MNDYHNEISRLLTYYEHPEEYPWESDNPIRDIAEDMYNLLVRIDRDLSK